MRTLHPLVVAGFLGLSGLAATGIAACGSSSPPPVVNVTGSTVPLPAGKNPSPISKEVCSAKAQREISEALGVTPTKVTTPTWVDHLYSCEFEYPGASFGLSVKELSSWPQTYAWFGSLQSQFGDTGSLGNLGQGAFSENDGSVVVRKDWKILTVDITGLPSQFGVPPTSADSVAVTVADVILGCWAGD